MRFQACTLDHGAVGHRVGEQHPQLDDVGTGSDEACSNEHRYAGVRIACR